MASTLNVVIGALVAAAMFSCIGLAVARRIAPAYLAWPLAPLLGWAVFNVVALPVFTLVGLSSISTRLLTGLALAAGLAALWRRPDVPAGEDDGGGAPAAGVPAWAWLGAAVLAIGPALAVLPKGSGDSVLLASAIFDHTKIAIVDDMVRLGVPPGNPFFGEVGQPARLAYYYLFHFSAAVVALVAGLSGWEADAAMTWFAAFASLMLMMGLAVSIAGSAAAYWVLPFALAASLRAFLALVVPSDTLRQVLQPASGFSAWFGHASWAPQHLMSASCVVLATWLMSQLVRRGSPLLVVTLGLVVAAGFESSTWVGGVTFAIAGPVIGVLLLAQAGGGERRPFAAGLVIAAVLAVCLAAPFILDQAIAVAARNGGAPLTLQPTAVLGEFLPDAWRRGLDVPAFWLVYLPVEFPAIYPLGLVAIAILFGSRTLGGEKRVTALVLAALAAVSLTVSWLLASQVGYNDLGWRAAIPGLMVLTIMSAVVLTRWTTDRAFVPIVLALALLAFGLYESVAYLRSNATGVSTPQGRIFARTPELWQAVRRHSGAAERVANNPMFLDRMTLWPGNVSWALLANRRSCFAADQLLLAFAPLPRARREAIEKQFIRVFAGDAEADDVRELADRYDCALAVVTAADGAWAKDPFAASPRYALVESKDGEWRIYRRAPPPRP